MSDHLSSRWWRVILLAAAIASCVQTLGIERAEVDPSFVAELEEPDQLASSEQVGECVPFDNSRLTNLGEEGRLPPLPEMP